jgi:hypothetical protein
VALRLRKPADREGCHAVASAKAGCVPGEARKSAFTRVFGALQSKDGLTEGRLTDTKTIVRENIVPHSLVRTDSDRRDF